MHLPLFDTRDAQTIVVLAALDPFLSDWSRYGRSVSGFTDF